MSRISMLAFVSVPIILAGVSGFRQSRTSSSAGRHDAGFQIVEASLADVRAALSDGRLTSGELVARYLARIATYEHRLHAALAVNPRAIEEGDQLDRAR